MSDLRQLSRMARLFGSWVPGMDLKPLLAELRERVAEELDYLWRVRPSARLRRRLRG